ncbi:uncharacterized protein LOC107039173 [Diachasma alloeum]|uniref:uncharacterized protein LOC107039173 n=1 Tax=Diachasma alloeum TaxID=454923 RepID=UPI0007382D9D|nr:uncharacterized protein LOC107039173 [Diachasma alloeum]
MPFVVRKIEPRYVGRGHVPQDATTAETWPVGAELGAVSNGTLASTLKQLASLLSVAEDIFGELTAELTSVADRSGVLRRRIDRLDDRLAGIDPKKIPVPESDICTFALRKEHFKASREPITGIFASVTRPRALQELYDAAAAVAVRNLDSLRREKDGSSMEMYLCTPVLGKRRRDQSLDIESRVPAVLEDLRRWTSSEALGDITVAPDCASRILQDHDTDDAVDHKLPSPEEQVQAIALKFPAEIVAVDVSGRGFERMSMRRRSLLSARATGENQDASVKRRSRPRRPRGKRRNTIAGTDRKEIRRAVGEESTANEADASVREDEIISQDSPGRAHRSASTDILGKKESPTERKWHFDTLKAWGMSRLKLISPKQDENKIENNSHELHGPCDDTNVYEMITTQRRKRDKSHERKPSSSSSSGKSIASSIAVSIPVPERPVKLRECAAQKRERRKGGNNRDDPPHSSSGNWSASSESGRASIGSETTTNPPRSTTTTSTGTCSMSLSHARRLRGRDTSTSSSVTSEGTLTPDIIQDIGVMPFSDDGEGEGETCSIYSCDTEGYYTSFHMDSGLKTLREEETVPQTPLTKSNEVSPDSVSPLVENEYELFGRGSTSTTTSSAGTVCTTLLAPPPPERKSSLTVVAMVHGQNKNGGESPDSGHNTSSSPVESASSPACTARSCSELEYSESSDLEGCERIERIRSKTAINTSRIPSMCVITPPGSDDENSKETPQESPSSKKTDNMEIKVNSPDAPGAVLMSATVGTSKMEVINGQDKNLYATVQTIDPKAKEAPSERTHFKTSPLSGMLDRIRGVLPLSRKQPGKTENIPQTQNACHDSGDYVTIADVRNNNDKGCNANQLIYSNGELFEQDRRDTEYVSLTELPKKPDSSLERKRQGARVTLDSEGKVVYSSDSLKRRKGTHTTFNPGPFVKETPSASSPAASPMFRRAQPQIRAVSTKQLDRTPTTRSGKLVIRAGKSPERATEKIEREQKQTRGAYVNVQSEEDNALLAFSSESASSQASLQFPPPYISPPQPQDWRLRQEDNNKSSDKDSQECQNHSHHRNITHQGLAHDPRHFIGRKPVFTPNQYYTLPNRKPQREIRDPIRCVTPDITRGLGKHQNSPVVCDRKNLHHNGQIISAPVDSRNRFFAPLGLSARGYRFFASSPVDHHDRSTIDNLNHSTISPVPTKPSAKSNPTVAQRLSTLAGNPYAYSTPTLSTKEPYSDSASVASSSGRTTPTNGLISPSRSTMSNEELFTAIHKSKRKLNIRNDGETLSDSTKSLDRRFSQTGTRHSWSPESASAPEVPPTVSPQSSTSRMDFKRLLLQQSTKMGPSRLSAAEQLKLSRQQCQQQYQPRSQQPPPPQPSLARALSPRSVWRFQTPRSDVLSSTIVEDAAAEERAMELSPENQVHNVHGRLRTRRQLDLCPISPIQRPINPVSITRYSEIATRNFGNDNRMNSPRSADSYAESESRRAKNQRARAEFLAGASSTSSDEHHTGFRARSESPRQPSGSTKGVARSPSAPTLETAL